jgi:alkylhydroperoxidase family enzyme
VLRNQKRYGIDPLTPPYDDAAAAALHALQASGDPLALFRVLARKPDRATAIHEWGRYYLSRRLSMSLHHRELVIERTTARCGSSYEWGMHVVVFAGKAGLTPEQARSTATGTPDDACWTDPADRAVLRAVDALVDRHDLDDAEWDALVDAVGEEGAVDLLMLCGWYHSISFVTRVLRLPQEPDTPTLEAANQATR